MQLSTFLKTLTSFEILSVAFIVKANKVHSLLSWATQDWFQGYPPGFHEVVYIRLNSCVIKDHAKNLALLCFTHENSQLLGH